MCKGSGMIHPDMATMLAVVLTDAEIPRREFDAMLDRANRQSFNRITVDGDTSTNDMLVALANGASGARPESEAFERLLTEVCVDLARMIVRDGEGATKFIELRVRGAEDDQAAERAAKTVATSLLVKTAFYGADANWGRILAALGRSGAAFDPERVELRIGPLHLLKDGAPRPFDEELAARILGERDIEVDIDLGAGNGEAVVWTSDLSHGYVSINADYRS
jgi:glutamate N-acetyltransferase/amino-acid N-acetyltransferase